VNAFLLSLGALLLVLAGLAGGSFVILLNVYDIAENGANFWNIFWIFLIFVGYSSGISSATSK
jgi:hypothetical protein